MPSVMLNIAGEWREGQRLYPSLNPSTGVPIGDVPTATTAEVAQAVQGARDALHEWRQTPVERRAQVLGRFAALLREEYGNAGEATALKTLIHDEIGKRLPEADIEVLETADFAEYFASLGPDILTPEQPDLDTATWPTKKSQIVYEPHGVVAAIKAWNYPLEIPVWSLLPALLAGNTIVFKPSEHAPFIGARIVELFLKAGLPRGVLSLVTGDGQVGRSLVRANDISFVSFTGSVSAGKEIAHECAERMIPTSLELGGSDPFIVLADTDLELATNGVLWGRFANCGQVCTAAKRLLVQTSILPEFQRRLTDKIQSLVVGRDIGPLISPEQLNRLQRQVEQSKTQGARVLLGGRRVITRQFENGFFFEPTLVADVTEEMPVFTEETFGPVLPLLSFVDDEDAVRIANASRYGLGASIWTRDTQRAKEIADRLDCGMVWINDVNLAFPQCPWVGRKLSGTGLELGEASLREYSRLKHVNWDEAAEATRDWWFPYPD